MLRVNEFDEIAKTHLDEWVQFLKTGEIDKTATAKGLPEARERLRVDNLSPEEKQAYYREMESIRYQKSVIETGRIEGRAEGLAEGREEGLEKGRVEEQLKIARTMKKDGLPVDVIVRYTGLAIGDIEAL